MNRAIQVFLQLLFAAVVGAAVFAAGGYYLYPYIFRYLGPPPRPELKSPSQRLAELPGFGTPRSPVKPPSVAALGRIRPRGDIIDIAGLMGDRLESLCVQERDRVKKGDTLGFLASHAEAVAQRDAAVVQLAEAKRLLEAERAYCDAQIEEAKIGVRQVQELAPLDIQAQDDHIRLLKKKLETHQTDLARFKSITSGAINGQTIDHQNVLVRTDELELQAAASLLDKVRSEAKLKARNAEAQLQVALAGRRRVEASSRVESLTKNLTLAEARLNRTILTAPRDGCILKILVQPGETADHLPILKMGDTDAMYAVAEVYETDIGWVREGQTATLTALTSELTGKVERVGQMVFKNDVLSVNPAADADTRVVEVWIKLDEPKTVAGLTNLQVDVKIDLTDPADAGGSPSPAN